MAAPAYAKAYVPEKSAKLAVLQRIHTCEDGTLSRITVDGQFVCFATELPWRDNKVNESCIPAGRYKLAWELSPREGPRLHVQDIPKRSHVMFHPANWQRECRGCIFPAFAIGHVGDGADKGYVSLPSSTKATEKLEGLFARGVEHSILIYDSQRYVTHETR